MDQDICDFISKVEEEIAFACKGWGCYLFYQLEVEGVDEGEVVSEVHCSKEGEQGAGEAIVEEVGVGGKGQEGER